MSENPRSKTILEIYGLPMWYAGAFSVLVGAVFALIALGGSVRIMNAGLACPDWPLCFGDVIPDYHPQVYFEFIHRVVAGFVAMAALALQFILLRSRAPRALKRLALGSLLLLFAQIVMGGLTVLLQLHSKVVAAHLAMGTGFFALLLWERLSLQSFANDGVVVAAAWVRRWSVALCMAVYGQIILGGLVASHFASLVCTDFPKCQGEWFPTFRGIIGLHMVHRLGAYMLFALILTNLWLMRGKIKPFARASRWMFGLVCVQISIGIANVLLFTPPLIAVGHLAVATSILGVALSQAHLAARHTG